MTTLVALFVGVFAIGLVLALGQNIRDEINTAFTTQVPYNSYIIAGVQDKAAVDAQVAGLTGVKGKAVNAIAQDVPVTRAWPTHRRSCCKATSNGATQRRACSRSAACRATISRAARALAT